MKMNSKWAIFLGWVFVGLFSIESFAQVEYHYYDTYDEVRVGYRWQRASIFQSNSDAVLNLELTNLQDSAVQVGFSVGFYRDNQLVLESPDNKVCLKPGQTRRGLRGDMRFRAEGITLDMIEEEWFSWELFRVEVTGVAGCD